jgi:hypothetical protein
MTQRSTRTVRLLLLAVAAGSLAAGDAWGWGATGHRLISRVAIESLPAEVPAFLRKPEVAQQMGELGREADRSKGAGRMHDAERDPGHFVNLADDATVAGSLPLDGLPATREAYDTALRALGLDQYQVGYLPYALGDGWLQLKQDFAYWRADAAGEKLAATAADRAWFGRDRQLRELLILRDLGYWSHYVGDASQPLHVSIHYNGWGNYPNPEGFSNATSLHGYVEGEFVRRLIGGADIAARLPPYRDCGCGIEARIAAYLRATQATVVPLYALEKLGGFAGDDARGKAFIAERLAAGAAELRDMVVDAWRQSIDGVVGYPPVPVREVEAGRIVPIDQMLGLD